VAFCAPGAAATRAALVLANVISVLTSFSLAAIATNFRVKAEVAQ
jgi:uncharacterized integral membrane protein